MLNWIKTLFTKTHDSTHESVQFLIEKSNINDTSTLHFIISSDNATIIRLEAMIKENCYLALSRRI